ncbi:MAG: N-acetyl-gamma-glutamyl-phosphate reductase [Campylobacterota bacterium]
MQVGVIGASGYTGLELIKMLIQHPKFTLSYVANSEGGCTVSQLHPSLEEIVDMEVEIADIRRANELDLVFLALPHKTAFSFAKDLTCKVVDLSADYRLDVDLYEKYYCTHGDKENMKNYAYGMVEHNRQELQQKSNVAVPGCYPTATLMGLLPFKEYIADGSALIIDAKSGISGAGKKCSEKTMFCKDNENFFAYAPLTHRHTPEIASKLGVAIQRVNFVPQLIPVTRGMVSNIYITLNKDIDAQQLLQEFYAKDAFVRVRKEPVELKNVVGTHFCDIYVQKNENILFISSAIDNLLRGASSQALACANIICGLDENTALPRIANVP